MAAVARRAIGLLGRGPLDPDSPVVEADDLGLTRGDGCFETTRVVTDDRGRSSVAHLPEHLERLEASCRAQSLPPPDRSAWTALVGELLAGWDEPGEALLKLMLSRGRESAQPPPGSAGAPAVTGIVTVTSTLPRSIAQRHGGIAVVTLARGTASNAYAQAPWLLGGVKSLSYAINGAALREAARRGADDAIFVSSDGFVLEAPTATVVWRDGDTLLTPPIGATGILASITQATMFEAAAAARLSTGRELVPPERLLVADGAWLVSSGRGAAPIRTLDGHPLTFDTGWSVRVNAMAGF
jgi:4-amino-4-deoxychorismate lyase